MNVLRYLVLLNVVFLVSSSHVYAMLPASAGWAVDGPFSPRRPAALVTLEEIKKEPQVVETPTSAFYSSASASSSSNSLPAVSSPINRRYAIISQRKMKEVAVGEDISSVSSGSGAGSSSMQEISSVFSSTDHSYRGSSALEVQKELRRNRDLLLQFRTVFAEFITKMPFVRYGLRLAIQKKYLKYRNHYDCLLSKAITLGLGCRITRLQDYSLEKRYPLDFKPLDDLGFLCCKACKKYLFEWDEGESVGMCICSQDIEGFSDAVEVNAQLRVLFKMLQQSNCFLTSYIDCIGGIYEKY